MLLPFSRKILKSYLKYLLESGVSKKKLSDIAARLDTNADGQAIPAAWELAMAWSARVNFLAQIEPNFGKGRPDIFIKSYKDKPDIIADVYTPSEKEFTFEEFLNERSKEISSIVSKRIFGCFRNDLVFAIHFSEWIEDIGGIRTRVPSVTRKPLNLDLVANHIDIQNSENFPIKMSINISNVIICTVNVYQSKFGSIEFTCTIPSHIQFSQTRMLQFMINKCKKQLAVNEAGLRGLIICDGGAPFMSGPSSAGFGTVSNREFFGQVCINGEIDFVFVAGVKNEMKIFQPLSKTKVQEIYFHPSIEGDKLDYLKTVMQSMYLSIPMPRIDGRNARKSIENAAYDGMAYSDTSSSWSGGREDMTVKVSSRLMSDFFAGKLDEGFFRSRMLGGRHDNNPFQGMTIVDVSYEKTGPKSDDDFVVFQITRDDIAEAFSAVLRR